MKVINWLKENKILMILIFIGTILRFYKIDFQSPWIDEIFTLANTGKEKSFKEIYFFLKENDPHPPLYYYIIHIVNLFFDNTSLVARAVSAVFGVAGLFAIYYLAQELFNKKVGIIAVALLSINYFHIYYSQEARMYSMLFLTTTLSFYFLIKLIKKPTIKSVILHAIFALLMIYSHFFALFTLFSQYIILLLFIVKPFNIERKKMLIYSIMSGIITGILYIPSFNIFLENTKRTSTWIPLPTVDVYTQIFKEFFGQSEVVVFFVLIIFMYYLFILFNKNSKINLEINPNEEKQIFSFLVLFIWIIITLILPLISSFVKLPMLISRYFINILPAIILLIAIGLYYIKNNIVKLSILSIFLVFSLTDIIIVKSYYSNVGKAQFREATNFIIKNNKNKEKVVTSLGLYMSYFLNNGNNNYDVIDKSLDIYISEIQQDTIHLKPFWYIDGFGSDYKPNDVSMNFINKYYYIDNNYDGFQAWTKHFVLLKDVPTTIDISKFKNLQQYNGDGFKFNVESFENNDNKLNLSGWAYFDKQEASNSEIAIILIKDGKATKLMSQKVNRPDVTTYFKSEFNLENSGFISSFDLSKLDPGKYQLGIYMINKATNKEGLCLTDKTIEH